MKREVVKNVMNLNSFTYIISFLSEYMIRKFFIFPQPRNKKENMETKLLLRPENFKPTLDDWKINGVLNPGAIRLPDGKILLMVRVAESCAAKKEEGQLCPRIVPKK